MLAKTPAISLAYLSQPLADTILWECQLPRWPNGYQPCVFSQPLADTVLWECQLPRWPKRLSARVFSQPLADTVLWECQLPCWPKHQLLALRLLVVILGFH